MDEMPVVRAFEVAQPGNTGGEMAARGRENCRFTDLAAQLTAQSVTLGELCQTQTGNETTTLR